MGFLLFSVLCKKTTSRKAKKDVDHTSGLIFVGVLLVLCFVPSIGYFIYNVYKDPDTPTILNNAIQLVKEKSFGNLSRNKAKVK